MKTIINHRQANEKEFEVSVCDKGSEKQIEWANQIKLNKISDIFVMQTQPGMSAKAEEITAICEKMNAINDAKFWIDNRNTMAKNIAKEVR
jgi:hypothetical protein